MHKFPLLFGMVMYGEGKEVCVSLELAQMGCCIPPPPDVLVLFSLQPAPLPVPFPAPPPAQAPQGALATHRQVWPRNLHPQQLPRTYRRWWALVPRAV